MPAVQKAMGEISECNANAYAMKNKLDHLDADSINAAVRKMDENNKRMSVLEPLCTELAESWATEKEKFAATIDRAVQTVDDLRRYVLGKIEALIDADSDLKRE